MLLRLLIVVIVIVYVIQFMFIKDDNLSENATCYVISLEHHAQNRLMWFRKNYMNSDIKRLPLKVIPAIDGKTLEDLPSKVTQKALQEIQEAESKGYRSKDYQLTRGAVGCYLSHLNVLQRIAASKSCGIVFEDDAKVPKRFSKSLNNHLYNLRGKSFDVLLFGCICLQCERRSSTRKVKHFYQTHGYFVTPKGAEKILRELNHPIEKQIDSALSDLCKSNALQVYCASPGFVRQGKFKTTIQIPLSRKSTIRRPMDP